MLFSVEQAFVGRDEKRTPLKTPAWEAKTKAVLSCFPVLRKGHFDLRSYLVTIVNTKWSHDHAGHMISGHVTLCSRHLDKDNYVDVEGSV